MSAVLALLSAAVWGSSDFIAGVLSRSLRPVAVVAWSQFIALVALSAVVLVIGLPPTGVAGWGPWSIGAGACGALGLLCFYPALATGTMGVVAPIASLGAIIPVVLGVLSGDQPSALAWTGIAVAIFGVVLASGPELEGGLHARPVLLACLAAVGFGLALFMIDRGSRTSVVHTMWGMRLTSCLGYAVLAVVARSVGGVRARQLPILTLVGLSDLAANVLFGVATSMGMVSIASVLGSLYPVATILLARYVLHERLRPIQIVGVAVALVGIVLLAGGGHG